MTAFHAKWISIWWTAAIVLFPTLFTGCADLSTSSVQSEDKVFSDSGAQYIDSEFGGNSDTLSEEEQEFIDRFLEMYLGPPQYGDLAGSDTYVAGPGGGPAVMLECSNGALAVTAGVAVGALASVLAVSGVAAAGVGATVTVPASTPLYAVAGGLIGFAASTPSWGECLMPLSQLGVNLFNGGYDSSARGVQSIVYEHRNASRSSSRAPATAQTAANECQPGGRQCNQIRDRYKNTFCKPIDNFRKRWNIDIHNQTICGSTNITCADIVELARLAAGCWKGRQAMTDRCYGGRADRGHELATEYAEGDFFSCVDRSFDMGCGDFDIEDRSVDSAENSYQECL